MFKHQMVAFNFFIQQRLKIWTQNGLRWPNLSPVCRTAQWESLFFFISTVQLGYRNTSYPQLTKILTKLLTPLKQKYIVSACKGARRQNTTWLIQKTSADNNDTNIIVNLKTNNQDIRENIRGSGEFPTAFQWRLYIIEPCLCDSQPLTWIH